MALTATATQQSRLKIIQSLVMEDPFVLSVSPHKKNVFYAVREQTTMGALVSDMSDCVLALKDSMPRIIIMMIVDECICNLSLTLAKTSLILLEHLT